MTLCHLPQIYTDGVLIQNHLAIYAVKQCVQQLTFLVPVRLPLSREDSLTAMIQFCRLFCQGYKLSFPPTQLVRA